MKERDEFLDYWSLALLLCLGESIINTLVVVCCFCSAPCGQPRFCMINYLRLYFKAPCAFSTLHPWDVFSTDSPETWTRVRSFPLYLRSQSFQLRDDREVSCLSHVRPLYFLMPQLTCVWQCKPKCCSRI